MWVGSAFGGFIIWWNTLGMGNLSEAMSAAGSLLVVAVTLSVTHRENKRHRRSELQARLDSLRAQLDEHERRASQVSLVAKRQSPTQVDFAVVNQSGRPILSAMLVDPQGAYVDGDVVEIEQRWEGVVLETIGVVPSGEPYSGQCSLVKRREYNHEDLMLFYVDNYGNDRWVFANGKRGPKVDSRSPVWQQGQATWEQLRRLDPWSVRLKRWWRSKRRIQEGGGSYPPGRKQSFPVQGARSESEGDDIGPI